MNRAPGKSDTWWARHETECGGTYTKIQEPALTKKQLSAMNAKERAGRQKNKLDSWVTANPKRDHIEGDTSSRPIDVGGEDKTSNSISNKRKASTLVVEDLLEEDSQKRARRVAKDGTLVPDSQTIVQCPICNQSIAEPQINQHLDTVHLS
jgi:hypothetical protein